MLLFIIMEVFFITHITVDILSMTKLEQKNKYRKIEALISVIAFLSAFVYTFTDARNDVINWIVNNYNEFEVHMYILVFLTIAEVIITYIKYKRNK